MSPAAAQQTVKIGLIMPYSGQFADTATQMDNAIKLYVKEHGDTVAGKKIEFIRKDSGGIAPDVAKRLAQELVVRDKVDILGGLILTPNALAIGDISAEAKKFTVIMNAATSIITTKSPYMARTSVTTPMLNQTLGTWAATKGGVKKVFTMVSDYGPGHDAEGAFHLRLQGSRRRDRRLGAFPGRQSGLLGLRAARQGSQSGRDLHLDPRRCAAGRGRQGAVRARHRSEEDQDPGAGRRRRRLGAEGPRRAERRHHHGDALRLQSRSARWANPSSRASDEISGGRNPDIFAIGGYDGMHLIYESLKKTGGKADGEVADRGRQGHEVGKPARPDVIDPETRDVVEDMYIRRVEMVGGQPKNVEFDKVENVKDPVKERMKKKQ